VEACVKDNASRKLDQAAYLLRYSDLAARHEAVEKRLNTIAAEKQDRTLRRQKIQEFIQTVRDRGAILTRFDKGLWLATVDVVTVYSEQKIVFRFRDGSGIQASTHVKTYT
jgi:hypothetical protein